MQFGDRQLVGDENTQISSAVENLQGLFRLFSAKLLFRWENRADLPYRNEKSARFRSDLSA
jgi:hypothetical protein